jgi:SAM-dependent methyltransferase
MPIMARPKSNANAEAQIAAAYNNVGHRYSKYADGSIRDLFLFEGRHAYGDSKTWGTIRNKLLALYAKDPKRLRVLDLGCGPGTWLRRVVAYAHRIGFAEITANGVDIADGQLNQARALSHRLAVLDGVRINFSHGDLRRELAADEHDICLCLYGVLNHIPENELSLVMNRIASRSRGYFLATVRTIGSTPTVYVDDVCSAVRFYQDNRNDRLDVEFSDGRRTSFQSHLFSRDEFKRLAAASFTIEDIRGLDLFHGRFANDPRWNPPEHQTTSRVSQELSQLEERYCRDPGFIDRAAHLLLVARHKRMSQP